MMPVMRSKVISSELPVAMAVLVALALYTTLVAGEQQPPPPCANMITKPYYIRSSGSPPCVNNPDYSPLILDLDLKMADLASSTVEGADGLTVGDPANLLPARRKLSSGDTAGSVAGTILTIIIIVAIIWCCCTGRCGCGRQQVVVVSQSQSQSQANSQTVNAPVTVMNNIPEQKPTVQYNLHLGPSQPVPTPGVGDLEMMGSHIMATGNAANAIVHAHVGGLLPGVHHNLQGAPGAGGWTGSPAPGFPAYTHPAHQAPAPASAQQHVQQHPAQPPQAQYPSPLSNYPSDKKPAASPLSNSPPKQP